MNAKQIDPDFFAFWDIAKTISQIIAIDSCKRSLIYKSNDEIIYYDYQTHEKAGIKNPKNIEYHTVTYRDGFFVFVAEYEIRIIKDLKTMNIFPQNSGSMFIRACIVKDDSHYFLITLSSNGSNVNDNEIAKYLIE